MQHRSERAAEWIVAVSMNILNRQFRVTECFEDLEYEQLKSEFHFAE